LLAGTRGRIPAFKIDGDQTTKADLVAALKGALAYCDKAYDGMTVRPARKW